MLMGLGSTLTKKEADELFDNMDTDGNGTIDQEEFQVFCVALANTCYQASSHLRAWRLCHASVGAGERSMTGMSARWRWLEAFISAKQVTPTRSSMYLCVCVCVHASYEMPSCISLRMHACMCVCVTCACA